MSYADKWTDEQVEELEKRIARIYSDAQKDFERQAKEYFDEFAERDEKQRKKVESGELSKEEYKQWRLTQMGRGERLDHMARQMAERATKANEVAVAYVNDMTPGIYSLNRNHEAYEIEKLGHEMVGADFSLYNESAVRRLVVEDPDLLPQRKIDAKADLDWNRRQFNDEILSGIMQGENLKQITDRVAPYVDGNRKSAVRAARTAITGAQNGGRQYAYQEAAKLGIAVRKRWIATKDGHTREAHGLADGQVVDYDKPFVVGGFKMMFPGDPSAPGHLVWNCRCTTRAQEKDGIEAEPRKMRVYDTQKKEWVVINEMTYQEWLVWKKNGD